MKKTMLLIFSMVFLFTSSVFGMEYLTKNYTLRMADVSGTTYYLQYVSGRDGWYMKAFDTSTSNVFRGSFHYTEGDTDYDTGWTNRATLDYVSGVSGAF